MTNAELIKAAGTKVGQFLYEHRGSFYKHYVDDRDACASWNPLRHIDDAMELVLKCELNIEWGTLVVDSTPFVKVGSVAKTFTPETKQAVLCLAIVEAVIKG
jgi:hypothetical protein